MSSSNTATPPAVASTPSASVTPATSAAREPTPLQPSSTSTPPATTSQAAPPTTIPTTSQTITSPAPTTTPVTTTTSTAPVIVTTTQAPLTSTFETVIVTTVSPPNAAPTTVTQTITSSPSITSGGSEVTDPSSSLYTPSTSPTDSSTANQPTSSLVDNSNGGGGGISGTAKVVVAVIVPIIGVAFVAILMLFLWKRRQKTRADAEARRKEVEEYGYNPNNDPHGGTAATAAGAGVARSNSNGEETLYEMTESNGAGYRGWGSTNGGRKPSNIGSSVGNSVPLSPVGMAFSDGGFTQQQQGIISPGPDGYTGVTTSPSTSTFPVGNSPSVDGSNAPLIHGSRPLTADSSVIGAMTGPAAAENSGGIHRGISNASSNYSAMTQSDQSDIGQPMSHHDAQYYGVDDGYEDAYYSSRNPAHPYSGDNGYGPAPVIRDVSARRNTRIETPTSTHFPQQGNSGIAQNF